MYSKYLHFFSVTFSIVIVIVIATIFFQFSSDIKNKEKFLGKNFFHPCCEKGRKIMNEGKTNFTCVKFIGINFPLFTLDFN